MSQRKVLASLSKYSKKSGPLPCNCQTVTQFLDMVLLLVHVDGQRTKLSKLGQKVQGNRESSLYSLSKWTELYKKRCFLAVVMMSFSSFFYPHWTLIWNLAYSIQQWYGELHFLYGNQKKKSWMYFSPNSIYKISTIRFQLLSAFS